MRSEAPQSRLVLLIPRLVVIAAALAGATSCNDKPAAPDAYTAGPAAAAANAPIPAPTVTVTVTAKPSARPPVASPKPSPRATAAPICKASQLRVFLTADRSHYSVRQQVVFTTFVANVSAAACDTVDDYGASTSEGVKVRDSNGRLIWPTGPTGVTAAPGMWRQHWAAHSVQTFSETWSQCTCRGVFVDGAYPSKDERAAPGTYFASAAVTLSPTPMSGFYVSSPKTSFTLDP